jgi:LmbE family N-acetylglucosaminyl deacetylase
MPRRKLRATLARMTRGRFLALMVATFFSTLSLSTRAQQRAAQYRIEPLGDPTGVPALSLALRQLASVGTLMQTTAHPDDENNAMLALYARHYGMRVALVTATRGDGGQNEIGPELFDALGILRTEELLAAHRFDGAEQYFTHAVDFGYSFSTDETLERWGRQEILADFVRHIRAIRPDVVVTLSTEGAAGGQHHQTSAILSGEAVKSAADPNQFPEQIKEGLHPWQARKLYRPAAGRGVRGAPSGVVGALGSGRAAALSHAGAPADGGVATLDTNVYEPLLGCTMSEIGSIASGMHMCQGRTPMVGPPSASPARYGLVQTVLPGRNDNETSLFNGIDVSLPGLAKYAGPRAPEVLTKALGTIAARVESATRTLEGRGPAATVPDLVAGLAALRDLRAELDSMGLQEDGKYEIAFRLDQKEEQFQQAIILAQALRIDVLADDGLIVRDQPITVSITIANRGEGDIGVRSATLVGFDGHGNCAPGAATISAPYRCTAEVRVPRDARVTGPYWNRPDDAGRATFEPDAPFGLPFRPTPFRVRLELEVADARVTRELPVQFRYQGAGFTGEKRMELHVVPAFAVGVSPRIAVVPLRASPDDPAGAPRRADARSRELRVTVINGMKGAASAAVHLNVPEGWRVTPPSAEVTFAREDEAMTTRFTVTAPAHASAGEAQIAAEAHATSADAAMAAEKFDSGYQVIEYPHIHRRHKPIRATATVKLIDVAIAPGLSIGYIMGVGDQVPPALEQLGARVTFLDNDDLAWGELSKYDAIVTGVRAYERRDDLKANNHRLLEYVEQGGTLIVQYNKQEFNQAQYGPYKALVSSNRITDERAPVTVLRPNHPLFTYPNRIDDKTWNNWVQERGLYFLGDRDSKYIDLVQMEDPFEYNTGIKTGALVEARYGKGRWVYVGLGLWRQLPSGTDGAYKLFANLISLGKGEGAKGRSGEQEF